MDAAPLLGDGSGGDYAPARTFKEFKQIVWSETVKTWLISGPVIFQIVCQYGTNSVTNIFLGWGTTGAGLALNISGWGIAIAQVIYVFGWCSDAWRGFSWLAFKDLWGFVQLSFSSAIMFCLEIWYMSSIVVLAGHLPNAVISVDSLSICMNLNGWENIIFIGVNVAMSVRVSNELGKGRPRAAMYSVYVTIAESLVLGLLFMVLIFFVKDHFAVIFTSSVAVQKYVAKLAYLLGITMVLNSVQ
ncbi:Protein DETOXIFICATION 35, partial [Cucurbita argyrosperma subsp. argyrosperma]